MGELFRPAIALLLSIAACGNETAPGDAATPAIRDSAGIRIVENTAPLWPDGEGWRLSEEPVLAISGYGEDPERTPLAPASAYLRGDGALVVADGGYEGWARIMIFDSTGAFRRSFGRAGEGPCEFDQLAWALPYRGDSVATHDYADHTIAIFDPAGACGREVRLPTWAPPGRRRGNAFADGADGPFADGSFLVYPMGYLDAGEEPGPVWYRHALLRVSPDGAEWDSLGLFAITQWHWTGSRQTWLPFGAYALRAVQGDGFFYGETDRFEVRRYASDGRLVRIIRRSHDPRPLTEERRRRFGDWLIGQIPASGPRGGENERRRMRRRLASVHWPERLPAYSWLLASGDGHLWVEEYRWPEPHGIPPDPEPIRWSVFDPEGRWLGRVELPGRLLLRSVAEDHVIGIWRHEDGVADVRVYRLIRGGR